MNTDLDIILNALKKRLARTQDWIQSPYLYLDPEGVLYLFQHLSGLNNLPLARLNPGGNEQVELSHREGTGGAIPIHIVYQALFPLLKEKIPQPAKKEDFHGLRQRYAWVKGTLQGTHFPDGNFNVEILIGDIRGVLFFTKDFFSSTVRPLLDHDRIFTLQCPVEALVYVHGEVRNQVFYHQTFGDNKEHDWLPLVPVAVQSVSTAD
ncbi:MAG: hypothetical protein JRG97_03840 [Deltaproteobacteria bacterium]|nr:hypothetical protein [Deltaproteobacteria bacterium]MBW2050867.1 hypothetical protein [Deltaproteobacteria bacterium]MBW2140187.1 hypothetical protein [Deltaproteobacteria bacterium]